MSFSNCPLTTPPSKITKLTLCILVGLNYAVVSVTTFVDNISFFSRGVYEYKEVMSQQFHLHNGLLHIHWFKCETLNTDNLRFTSSHFSTLLRWSCQLTDLRSLSTALDTSLILVELPLNAFHTAVNRGVHVWRFPLTPKDESR